MFGGKYIRLTAKLTNLTPLFKKHLQADDEAMTAVWKCIEDGMRNSSGKSLTL